MKKYKFIRYIKEIIMGQYSHLIRTEVFVHNIYSSFWMYTYKLIYVSEDGNN